MKCRLRKLEQEERSAVSAQIAGMKAGASADAYTTVFEKISGQRSSIKKQLDEAEKQLPSTRKDNASAPAFGEIMAAVEDALKAPEISAAERHDLLATIVERIVPYGEGVRVYLKSLIVGDTTVAHIPLLA